MASGRTDTESVLKLVIDNTQAKTSVKELRDAYYKLNTEINNMKEADNPTLYRQKVADIQKVKRAWEEARKEIAGATENVSSFRDQMGDLAKQAVAGLSVAGIFYGITNGIKTAIVKNAELSDIIAGVMKTTGLAEESVDRLNEKFKKIDTRTASTQLLELAQVAGKLGYSSEKDVEGFVRAADKIGVALGEDLGSVEESVNELGKLVNIFKLGEEFELEDALLKVGSAINTLGAEGTAAEKNLIDFAQRLAGVAPAANISLPSILAYGAVMDELGQSMESSSTAIGQFIVGMGSDIPKFAKIAGMSVKEFSDLLLNDANEALLRVLENSKTAGGGVQALATNMGILEVSGGRGIAALGAMADNIDLVRTRLETSNIAFDDGTSIIDEFNTVNNNLAANLEKIWNRINQLWENSTFRNWLTDITSSLIDFGNVNDRIVKKYDDQEKALNNLETSLYPLLDRYDELKSKTKLSTDEQTELKTIISQVAILLPDAVTEWDRFGDAMDINRVKVMNMTTAQKELLQIRNKSTIQELQESFDAHKQWNKLYTESANDLQKRIQNAPDGGFLSLIGIDKKGLWRKDVKEFNDQAKLMLGTAYDAAIKLRGFGVELSAEQSEIINAMEGPVDVKLPKGKKAQENEGTPKGDGKSKADLAKEQRAKEQQERLEKQAKEHFSRLLKEEDLFAAQQLIDQMDKNDKEVAQLELEYQKKIDKFEEFKLKEGASKADKAKADEQIAKLTVDRDAAIQNLRVKHEEDVMKYIMSIREELGKKTQTELDQDRKRINNHYENLLKDAGTAEATKDLRAQIEKARIKDLADAEIREAERLSDVKKKLEEEQANFSTDKRAAKIADIQLKYAREIELLKEKNSTEIQETEAFKEVIKAYETNREQEITKVKQQSNEERKQMALDVAQTLADATFSIISNNIAAESSARLAQIDSDRQRELSAKNLTEKQKQTINDKYDKLQKAEKLKAWKAQKRADMLSAIINTALAVTKALPNWILAGVAAVAGAAQVAVIASQKPPQFAKGGFIPDGPSHANGGINLMSGKKVVGNIEGGEPILSRNTYSNNREIVDALLYNSQRRDGARIQLNPVAIEAERAQRSTTLSLPAATMSTGNNQTLDNSAVVALLQKILEQSAKERPVIISNRLLEDHNEDVARIRNKANS